MEQTSPIIEIGMADMKMVQAPATLVTRGLGSCLGVVFFEPFKKIGALFHPMLPKIDEGRVKTNPYKFVDSGIATVLEEFKKRGVSTITISAKIFGGGHMFSSIPSDSIFNIGARNAEVAREVLASCGVKVLVEDTGGNRGRTIFFDVATGRVIVKTLFHGEKIL
jgi:chemotaxis protein CheD